MVFSTLRHVKGLFIHDTLEAPGCPPINKKLMCQRAWSNKYFDSMDQVSDEFLQGVVPDR